MTLNRSETVRSSETEFFVRPDKTRREEVVLEDIGSAVMFHMVGSRVIHVSPDTVKEDMMPWLNGLSKWEEVPEDAEQQARELLGVRREIDSRRMDTPEEGSRDEVRELMARGASFRDELFDQGVDKDVVRKRLGQELQDAAESISAAREAINTDTDEFNNAYMVPGVGLLYEVLEKNGGILYMPKVKKIREIVQFGLVDTPSTYTAITHDVMPEFTGALESATSGGGGTWGRLGS